MVEKHLSAFKDSRSVPSPVNRNTSPNSDAESESAIEDLSPELCFGQNPSLQSMSMLNIHVLNAFLIMAMFENFIQYSIYCTSSNSICTSNSIRPRIISARLPVLNETRNLKRFLKEILM